jgi:hypothetical protein
MWGSQIVALESSAGISGEVTVPVREQRSGSLTSFRGITPTRRKGAHVKRRVHAGAISRVGSTARRCPDQGERDRRMADAQATLHQEAA